MKVLSCNVRTSGANDGENNWVHRRDFCIRVILAESPDLVGFQEVTGQQLSDLIAGMPGFSHYGLHDAPAGDGPRNVIFYRTDRFELIAASGYWLSERPHVAASRSWESACVRLANWVRLHDRQSGEEFRYLNTHLDHISQQAREMQALMLVEDTVAYPAAYRQILSGDLNCDRTNRAIDILLQGGWRDTYAAVHGEGEPGFTFHAFAGERYETALGKIDWIFTRGALVPTAAKIIRDAEDGRYPSDHYFISTTLKI